MRGRFEALREEGIVLLLFAAAALIVRPSGDMPLNDDFNFAHATWHFAETGTIEFTRLTGMSLRLQVLWGALWTSLFGASFVTLRASTLFLAAASILVAGRILRDVGTEPLPRLACLVVFAANPIFFWSSFTFMTQVPFLFMSIVSLFATLRFARSGERRWGVIAVAAVLGSCFIRQTGIANAAPLLLLAVLRNREREGRADRWLAAVAVPLIFVPLYFLTPYLHGYPGQIGEHFLLWKSDHLLRDLLHGGPLHWTVYSLQYAALFCLPLLLPLLSVRSASPRQTLLWLALSVPFVGVATMMVTAGLPMPYRFGGNVLINFGFGPLTLRDTFCFDREYPHVLPTWLRALGTYVAAVLATHIAFVMITRVWVAVRERKDLSVALLIAQAAASVVLLFPSGIFFDRYVLDALWVLPLLITLVGSWRLGRVAVAMGIVQLALCALLMSEYFSWNRARWRAWDFARGRGVTIRQIDAGYEVNQSVLGGVHGKWRLDLCGMSVVDDQYILTFTPVRGYDPVASFGYASFAGIRRGQVVLSRRSERYSPLHRFPPKKESFK